MIREGRWDETTPVEIEQAHWVWRLLCWLVNTLRPHLGWLVLIVTMLLALLPTLALGENRQNELRTIQAGIDPLGPLAVLVSWLLLGWRQPRPGTSRWVALGRALLLWAIGLLLLSQLLLGWLPSGLDLVRAALSGTWLTLGQGMVADWSQLLTRIAIWWQGVQGSGAQQDSLIFGIFAGLIFWGVGLLTAWLVRRTERGLTAALPVLWLLGTMLLYTGVNRGLMLGGVALAIVLHLLLDQQAMMARWQRLGLDYSTDLLADRLLAVCAVGVVVTIVAAVMPNLYYRPLVMGYYAWIQPFEARIEGVRDRLFPDLQGVSRLQGGTGSGGMPNAFLLGGNVSLGETVVMQVRTNEAVYYDAPIYEMEPPPGHYMRGATFASYDGHGWDNPTNTTYQQQDANTPWTATLQNAGELVGRKPLLQTITLFGNSSVLFGAPEPVEAGVEYQAQVRTDGDLIALRQRTRTYTIISAIPAVSEAMLIDVGSWNEAQPLPATFAQHLALPQTISERTRALAAELTADQPTMYEKGRAIERFLRQYTYDLAVPPPPAEVADVADYFLFDLQRGYCDYYATAFIVLARLAGLPTRFATGYAAGSWNSVEMAWMVTEGEAHSWPEVYFPQYGWIGFEPTAGRAELTRIGFAPSTVGTTGAPLPLPAATEATGTTLSWNWQMLFWLLPHGLLLWGAWLVWRRWQQGREDPWLALLRWGQRVGRPIGEGETVLEYGHGLAEHVLARQTQTQDIGRLVAREVQALSQLVNRRRYGNEGGQTEAAAAIGTAWARLRSYLDQVRL